MTAFIRQGMIADKLTTTVFAQKILLPARFLAIFLYFCTLAIRAIEDYFYYHNPKILLYSLITKFLL
jgi:hypothetical protein